MDNGIDNNTGNDESKVQLQNGEDGLGFCQNIQIKKIEEQMDNLKELVEKDFEKAISQLVNEIDLLFDYVPKDIKYKLQKYSENISLNKEFRVKQMKSIMDKLKPFEDKIYDISIVKKKTKTSDLEFLDSLILFEDVLDMKMFSHENKNTKISLVNYLSTMYLSGTFGSFGMQENFNVEELSKEMTNFIESVKQKAELKDKKPQTRQQRGSTRRVNTRQAVPGGMGGLLSTLMSNPDIMNMAADLTQDLQQQNIDPMTLMSSLMTGNPSGHIGNLVNKITNTLEQKISSGAIDKDSLEHQAEQIMSAVQSSDFASQVPMLQTLMQGSNLGRTNNKQK